RVDALGQRERAGEGAGGPLHAVVALLALLVLGLALTGDREDVVLQLDLDVILAHAGEIGAQDVVVSLLDQVHRGDPAAQRAAVARAGGRVEESAEQPVHFLLNRLQLAGWLPSDNCHRDYLLRSMVIAYCYARHYKI